MILVTSIALFVINISKDFLYYIQNSFDQGYHLMETLRRMTIFVIGTFGVLILVLMEGDY